MEHNKIILPEPLPQYRDRNGNPLGARPFDSGRLFFRHMADVKLRALRSALAIVRGRINVGAAMSNAFPYSVEVSVGYGSQFDEMLAFHRDRSIPHQRSETQTAKGKFATYCFAQSKHAGAFLKRFGNQPAVLPVDAPLTPPGSQ
jgi:hypothetical protein